MVLAISIGPSNSSARVQNCCNWLVMDLDLTLESNNGQTLSVGG
jgi:hypothetical protein